MKVVPKKVDVNIPNNACQTPLMLSCYRSFNSYILRKLVENGADLLQLDNEGKNVLHLATYNDFSIQPLQFLLNKHSSLLDYVNKKDFAGCTPLHYAGKCSYAAVILEKGGCAKIKDDKDFLPSVKCDCTEQCELSQLFKKLRVLKYNVDVNEIIRYEDF